VTLRARWVTQASASTGDRANRVADGMRVVRDHLQTENAAMREELNTLKRAATQHRLELSTRTEEVCLCGGR
jgi:hypothetical protein